MTALLCSEAVVTQWLKDLSQHQPLYFPQRAPDGAYRFEPVRPGSKIGFEDYQPTQSPPGQALTPAHDVLFTFEGSGRGFVAHPALDESPRMLAGVRPCDLRAIHLMDAVHHDAPADENYQARRRNTQIVAWACARPCNDRCFCAAVGSLDWSQGADVMLAPVREHILVQPQTAAGETLLKGLTGEPCEDPEAAWQDHRDARPKPFGRALTGTLEQIHEALVKGWNAPVWQTYAERCLACGTCNLVCPTCYCFDTFDEVDLAQPQSGRRCRTPDSCMLREFASVAGGHEFRGELAARQRHRIKRKFEYLPDRYGGAFCVGCGRCGTQCTVDIDIFDMVNALVREAVEP